MKINKKILIPVFATAMGLSVIGGISGAVAWYQYNTKVSASWVGATMGDGGTLQISKTGNDGTWVRDITDFAPANAKLHPVTYGALGATDSLPSTAPKMHPEYGVTDPTNWKNAVEGTDYYQFSFKMRAQKLVTETDGSASYKNIEAPVYLDDVVLQSANSKNDVVEAVRVHIHTSANDNYLFSKTASNLAVKGSLDLDGDGAADIKGGYAWVEDRTDVLSYGEDGVQASTAFSSKLNSKLFDLPEEGLTITITIWLEGWQKLRSETMAMWDPTKDVGSNIQFGIRFNTPKTTFFADEA